MRLLLVLAWFVLFGCRKPEPIERADYWVQNGTTQHLRIAHEPNGNVTTALLSDSILVGQRVRILSVAMGSGGHAMPSNFFKSFSLMAGDSAVYSGVNNSHWQREGLVDGRHQLVLTIN